MGARDSAQLDRAAALALEASALTEDENVGQTGVGARPARVRAGRTRHASEMVLAGAETIYDCDAEGPPGMLIEVVRMAYFADEAPALVRAPN